MNRRPHALQRLRASDQLPFCAAVPPDVGTCLFFFTSLFHSCCSFEDIGFPLTTSFLACSRSHMTQAAARPPPTSHGPTRCTCLLYTSDAADEEDSVDLGGLRFI
eukprot:TRINITY_DN42985_c0_g1_i1.p1 TRINITY_DN42985_c0_g1~~TRINITY_DN42985_c0_g1_i1.p1  ORF type:complete len:105 (+),score=5.45 TRINITY_DN42985_c0_g1_i1:246-560(+)